MLNYLRNGPKNFLGEHSGHQIRKTLLDIISRFPFNELRNHMREILPLCYNLIEVKPLFFGAIFEKIILLFIFQTDNEENAGIALRIATDYHKKIHPQKNIEEVCVFGI